MKRNNAKTKTNLLWGSQNHAGAHGGSRPGGGRPPKKDKAEWSQITCVLRKDTIAKLRAGAATKELPWKPRKGEPGKHFGDYLQFILDRHPFPNHEEYAAFRDGMPIHVEITPSRSRKRRKVPLIISAEVRRVRMPRRPKARLTKKQFTSAILAAE